VVGVFRSDVSLWQARLVVTSLETAAHLFDQPGLATDLTVRCRPGYAEEVARAVRRGAAPSLAGALRPRVVAREELAALLPQGTLRREGVFTVLSVLAFAAATLAVLVTSGAGLAERRREVAILKATGWQTDELLLRSLAENALLGLAGAALSVVLAVGWLRGLNGYGVAGMFLAGVGAEPGFRVPFRLAPAPALLALLVSLVVALSGSLYSTWRAATAPAARGHALRGSVTALELRQACKYYRAGPAEVRALEGVSLEAPAGSFTLLAGPSGSGKTTLLALLGGLERPTRGQVLFAGRDLGACSDVELARLRRRVGLVFQDFALIPGLPAWENVTYPLIPRGARRGERYRLAVEWLGRLGLAGRARARPRELSGGEQQRVALARALVGGPEVILADEPTSSLDPAAGEVVIALLRQAHAEGKTVVVSSHDARLEALATRVCELSAGRLVGVRDVSR
jgi:ABC-type lipoprotein export system ATPase subunit